MTVQPITPTQGMELSFALGRRADLVIGGLVGAAIQRAGSSAVLTVGTFNERAASITISGRGSIQYVLSRAVLNTANFTVLVPESAVPTPPKE